MTQHIDTRKRSVKNRVNGHILVADDDVIGQIVTVKMLEHAGYQVDVVSNGLEVIKALETIDYKLVIMDCFMPGLDGFATTQAIRNTESKAINPDVPVIALTALTMSGDREKCMEAGMDDHVIKPVDSNLLIAAVERCLGRAFDEEPSLQQAGPGPAAGLLDSNETGMQEQQSEDPNFLDSIIDQFVEKVPQEVARLQKALGRGDVAELHDISHRLRGLAGILKASTLSGRAHALEQAARARNLNLAAKLTQELTKELQKLATASSEEQEC